MKFFLNILFFWTLLTYPLSAQFLLEPRLPYSAVQDSIFQSVIDHFRNNRIVEARNAIETIRTDTAGTHLGTLVDFMEPLLFIRTGEFSEADFRLKDFQKKHPASAYVGEVRILKALLDLRNGREADALRTLEYLYLGQGSHYRDSVILAYIDIYAGSRSDLHQLQSVAKLTSNVVFKSRLLFRIGELALRGGDLLAATEAFTFVANQDISPERREQCRKYLSVISYHDKIDHATIGIMLPSLSDTTDDYHSVSNAFKCGYELAVREVNEAYGLHMSLITHETGRNAEVAADAFRSLNQSNVLAAIGPLFNHELNDVVRRRVKVSFPLVLPTANVTLPHDLASGVFRLSHSTETRTRAMIQFSKMHLNAATYLVLASRDQPAVTMGLNMRESLVDISPDNKFFGFYNFRSPDVKEILTEVRRSIIGRQMDVMIDFRGSGITYQQTRQLIVRGYDERVVDSLWRIRGSIEASVLLGGQWKQVLEELAINTRVEVKSYLNMALPVTVDAIMVFVNKAEELAEIIRQIEDFNIRGVLVGTTEWTDADPTLWRSLASPVYILSEYHPIRINDKGILQRLRGIPNEIDQKLMLLAYDACMVVLELILKGNSDRVSLTNALQQVRGKEGVLLPMTFNTNGENVSFSLQKVEGGILTQVSLFSVEP